MDNLIHELRALKLTSTAWRKGRTFSAVCYEIGDLDAKYKRQQSAIGLEVRQDNEDFLLGNCDVQYGRRINFGLAGKTFL